MLSSSYAWRMSVLSRAFISHRLSRRWFMGPAIWIKQSFIHPSAKPKKKTEGRATDLIESLGEGTLVLILLENTETRPRKQEIRHYGRSVEVHHDWEEGRKRVVVSGHTACMYMDWRHDMRGSEVEPIRMGNRVGRDEMLNGTQVDNSEAVSASEPDCVRMMMLSCKVGVMKIQHGLCKHFDTLPSICYSSITT